MVGYSVRRLLQAIFIVIIVSVGIFLAMRLLPGDPILLYMSSSQAGAMSDDQIEIIRHEYGLDKPMYQQYINWMIGIFHGNLGKSIQYEVNVTQLIAERAPVTLYLGLISFVLGNIIGIFLGVVAAIRRGKVMDMIVTFFANIGITIPIFWLGILLIYIFAFKLGLFPTNGFTSPFDDFWLNIRQIIMPVACMSIFCIGAVARQTRSSMLEVTRQDYIRTAWSKGLSERIVVFRHVLKNGLIPVVTLSGMQVTYIVGGAVIIETVFNISGMGRLAVGAIQSLDYAVIQSIILLISAVVVLTNFVVDISYGWLNPRIRYT